MEQWNQIFTAIILPLLTALIGLTVAWLNKKRAELVAKIENETFQKYYNIATEAVLIAVADISQTFVDSLKASGKFDATAQTEAFEKARAIAESMISDAAKAVIEEAYGDFNTWIATQIEAAVRDTKST